jgi:hypothetical protein
VLDGDLEDELALFRILQDIRDRFGRESMTDRTPP